MRLLKHRFSLILIISLFSSILLILPLADILPTNLSIFIIISLVFLILFSSFFLISEIIYSRLVKTETSNYYSKFKLASNINVIKKYGKERIVFSLKNKESIIDIELYLNEHLNEGSYESFNFHNLKLIKNNKYLIRFNETKKIYKNKLIEKETQIETIDSFYLENFLFSFTIKENNEKIFLYVISSNSGRS